MKLEEVMKGIPYEVIQRGAGEISSLSYDSRKVQPGACCACERGRTYDGADYLEEDYQKGAAAAVLERIPRQCPPGMTLLKVKNIRAAMPRMAANFYKGCLDGVSVTGITGTNGKTTTSTLMYHILQEGGRRCSLLGTNENRIGKRSERARHTTPMPFDLFALFQQMRQEAIENIVMEVSSHALDQHRVDAVPFRLGLFTNLTRDHLDYHGTMQRYRQAKAKLFQQCAQGLLNGDDPNAEVLRREAGCFCRTYGLSEKNDYSARNLVLGASGLQYDWYYGSRKLGEVRYPVPGRFNVYNTLAAISACRILGMPEEVILKAEALREPMVAGRFEVLRGPDGLTAIVDYAHTPDGLRKVLETIREFAQGRVIVVFGCGGDRDRSKRPMMGYIAGELGDYCILTSDNPRSENPERILDQIETGLRPTGCPYQREADRRMAIAAAIERAEREDVVLVAGKGHETYQLTAGRTSHFDDTEEVRRALEARSPAAKSQGAEN